MKLIKLIPLLFLVALNAQATMPALIWCGGCTDGQKQSAAAAVTPISTVYVGDVIGGNVTAFSLERENPNFAQGLTSAKGATLVIASRIPGDSNILNLVSSLITFYDTAPAGWGKHFVFYTNNARANVTYSNPNVNIYNVVNPGIPQNRLTDWASQLVGSIVGNIGMNRVQPASRVHLADMSHDPQISITIELADGSHVDAVIDYSTTNPKFKLDPTTARDSHNNNVPYLDAAGNINAAGGTFGFNGPGNPNDLSNWLAQMQLLGIPVGTVGSTFHGWACTVSGEGQNAVYSCRKY